MNYVSSLLIDNSVEQMRKEAKLYGLTINTRLLFIEEKLKNYAQQISSSEISPKQLNQFKNKEFNLLALQQAGGKTIYLNENKKQIPVLSTKDIDSRKSQIFTGSVHDETATLYMRTGWKSSYLTAIISPIFLWGDKDNLPLDKNICVIESNNKLLFCSISSEDNIHEKIKNTSLSQNYFEWVYKDENYLATSWEFFLKSRFDTISWNIITSQKESNILQPIKTFNKIFALIIFLTLLIVSLVSLAQVRRSLTPLESLIDGTRRVAENEFTTPVEVHSNDEFKELATSFNSMSKRLGSQINSLSWLSEIDQLILSDPTDEKILTAILKRIKEMIPSAEISITLFEHEQLEIGRTYFSENDHPDSKNVEITSFHPEDIKIFLTQDNVKYLDLTSYSDIFPHPLKSKSARSAFIFPVKVKQRLSALIYLGSEEELELNEDELLQLYEISNRLAIALASADKDKKLYQQSHFDNLTQLPNRLLFNDRLEQEIIHAKRQNKIIALLFIDLDRFKHINDTLGHLIGDKLLQLTAERLKKQIRETDTVARLAGDEFTLILSDISEPKDAGVFARNLIDVISKPFYIETHEIFINASIGISVYPFDGTDNIELLKNSDTAMYRVKSNGRGSYMFFEEQMNYEDKERASLERDLHHALENDELELYYQPLVNLNASTIVGAETLLRWNHPKRGIVPCANFIPLAEETGMIDAIGEWVVNTACKQYQIWKLQGVELERIAVNISNRQFLQDDFYEIVVNALESAEMPASCLELEITESVLVENRVDIIFILNKLKELGVSLSIDDFGTGYSSFSYLKHFPINTLKIDRYFMTDVPKDKNANSIVSSMITLAHTLNIKVISEGIETKEQMTLLQNMDCDYGQGFYFKPPQLPQHFIEYVLQQNTQNP